MSPSIVTQLSRMVGTPILWEEGIDGLMDWWVDEDALGGLNHPKLGIELMCVYIYWLVVWNMTFIYFYDFPFSWEWNNHPNWRSPSFFRGVGQPPTSIQYMYVFVWCWLYIWLAWNPLLKGCWGYDYTTIYHQYEGRYGLVDKTHPSCVRPGLNTRVQH